MALKNKDGNKKKTRHKISSSDFRFEISEKNCIRITLGPVAVFFFQNLTSKAALCSAGRQTSTNLAHGLPSD